MGNSGLRSDDVGEGFFGLTEVVMAPGEHSEDEDAGAGEGGPMDLGLIAEEAPAKAVDDADHGVEGVGEFDPVGEGGAGVDAIGGEEDGGAVGAELEDEGDDVHEVAVFDVEGGEPEAGAEGGEAGEEGRKSGRKRMWALGR